MSELNIVDAQPPRFKNNLFSKVSFVMQKGVVCKNYILKIAELIYGSMDCE